MSARGYADFSALLWVGLVIGVLLGACGTWAGGYMLERLRVEWSEPRQ